MRSKFLGPVVCLIVLFVGCGGAGSDNPPSISGFYQCNSGCTSICQFPDFIQVQQDGDEILVLSDLGTAQGTINNDGDFNFDTLDLRCEGNLFNQQLVANCSSAGTRCQEVAYQRAE